MVFLLGGGGGLRRRSGKENSAGPWSVLAAVKRCGLSLFHICGRSFRVCLRLLRFSDQPDVTIQIVSFPEHHHPGTRGLRSSVLSWCNAVWSQHELLAKACAVAVAVHESMEIVPSPHGSSWISLQETRDGPIGSIFEVTMGFKTAKGERRVSKLTSPCLRTPVWSPPQAYNPTPITKAEETKRLQSRLQRFAGNICCST